MPCQCKRNLELVQDRQTHYLHYNKEHVIFVCNQLVFLSDVYLGFRAKFDIDNDEIKKSDFL